MTADEVKKRTKAFTIRVMKLVGSLPETRSAIAVGNQLVRSGTSVGANYRAACRARSKAEFLAKLGIVEEEADETCYWLEIIGEGELLPRRRIAPSLKEASETTAIIVASVRTAKSNPKSAIRNPK